MGDRETAAASLPAMMPHQEEAVRFLTERHGRAMIADDPGLGKSRVLVEYARRTGQGVLVVTTKSFLFGWREEVRKWWPEARVSVIQKRGDVCNVTDDFIITTYDLVWRHGGTFDKLPHPILCFDESHKLMNRTSNRSKAAREMARGRAGVICLTGTPQPNGQPQQLWHQLLLTYGRFYTWKEFAHVFCDAKQVWSPWASRWVWDYTGSSNEELLKRVMKLRVLRRTKALLNLPPLSSSDVVVPLKLERKAEEAWPTYAGRLAEATVTHTCRLLDECIEQGRKVIIFTSTKAVRDRVWAAAEVAGYMPRMITAGTPPAVRSLQVREFQENAACRIFVATTQIASEAITLTAADVVIFNDLPWQPGMFEQAKARAHRKGQTKSVHVYCMMPTVPYAAAVKASLERKREVTVRLLDQSLGGKRCST